MRKVVVHKALAENTLEVELPGVFSSAKYYFNGQLVKPKRGSILVKDIIGKDLEIKIKPELPDFSPKLTINGETVHVVRKLEWYEYVLTLIPFLLVPIGGAIGGGLGMFAILLNARILRSEKSNIQKYSLSALVILVTFVTFMILATLIQSAINR